MYWNCGTENLFPTIFPKEWCAAKENWLQAEMSGPSGKDIFCHIKYQEHLAVLQYICWLPSGLLQHLPAGGKRMPFQGCLSFYFSITILKRLRLHRDTYSSTPTYVGQNHTKNLLLPKLLIEQFSGFWVHFTSVSPLGWNVLTVLQRLDVTPISSSCLLFWALKPYWGTGHSAYLRLILVPWFCLSLNSCGAFGEAFGSKRRRFNRKNAPLKFCECSQASY